MTIEGAKKAMRKRTIAAEEKGSDMDLLEQLQTLRAMLVEMRDCIGEEETIEEVQNTNQTEVANPAEEQSAEPVAEQVVEPAQKKKRAPRRKLIGEEGVVERPLFPFYEQTLF